MDVRQVQGEVAQAVVLAVCQYLDQIIQKVILPNPLRHAILQHEAYHQEE
jgi:hypothetical protein